MDRAIDLRNTLYLSVVIFMALCFGGDTLSHKIRFGDESTITLYYRPYSFLCDKLWEMQAAGLTSTGKFVYGKKFFESSCSLFFYLCEYIATQDECVHFDTAEDYLFLSYSDYFTTDDYSKGGKYCDFSNATCRNMLQLSLLIGFVEGFSPHAFAFGIMMAVIFTASAKRKRISVAYMLPLFSGLFIVNTVAGAGNARHLWLSESCGPLCALTNLSLALFLFLLAGLLFWCGARRRKAPSIEVDDFVCYTEKVSPRYKMVLTLVGFLFGMFVALPCLARAADVYGAISEIFARVYGFWFRMSLLSAYNLAFLFPLFAVFAIATWGVNLVWLSGKDSRSLRETKIVLGIVAALYGIFLLLSPIYPPIEFIMIQMHSNCKNNTCNKTDTRLFCECDVLSQTVLLHPFIENGRWPESISATEFLGIMKMFMDFCHDTHKFKHNDFRQLKVPVIVNESLPGMLYSRPGTPRWEDRPSLIIETLSGRTICLREEIDQFCDVYGVKWENRKVGLVFSMKE